MANLMTVREVAAYLNIKERKVYDLIHRGDIPCSRVGGKWIFPQNLIDDWVAGNLMPRVKSGADPGLPTPPVIAGSHDPLLEWSARQSSCGLALMPGGSTDGMRRLAAGEARVVALHLLDAESGEYNVPAIRGMAPSVELVLLEWARRRQGLVTAAGNPLALRSMADLRSGKARVICREPGSGTDILYRFLLARDGGGGTAPPPIAQVARSHTEVGLAVLEGRADAGLAVEAVAQQMRLGFMPLHTERFDLALRPRDYFSPEFQTLITFTRQPAFVAEAKALGYDISGLGAVQYHNP